jgi:hypothetical protein
MGIGAQVRSVFYLAISLLLSGIIALGQENRNHTFVKDLAGMPQQLNTGTLIESSFISSLEDAVIDPGLDFDKIDPLLAADLRSTDVRVRRYATLSVHELATRRLNSLEELRPLLPAIISATYDAERGVRLGSIAALAGLHPSVPNSVVTQLRDEFINADVNQEKFAILAGVLSKLRPNDAATDAVITAFLKSPQLSDAIKGQALHELGSPVLSDSIASEIVQVLRSPASEQVRMNALLASENIGPRTLNLERESLTAIQTDKTASFAFRSEALKALRMIERE